MIDPIIGAGGRSNGSCTYAKEAGDGLEGKNREESGEVGFALSITSARIGTPALRKDVSTLMNKDESSGGRKVTFGIRVPNSGPLASPESIVHVAKEAESLGYDSIWVHDHLV